MSKAAGRVDAVEKETAELEIISSFLPKMLSEDETRKILNETMVENQIDPLKRNMGFIMKSLPKVDGLDRKLVSKILQGILK